MQPVTDNDPTSGPDARGDVPESLDGGDEADVNTVRLTGRVSAVPMSRRLPSGDELATFRLVARRPTGERPRAAVDTLDIACWSGETRRVAGHLAPDDRVEVVGAVRRRFFRTVGGPRSRHEIEAWSIRRLS